MKRLLSALFSAMLLLPSAAFAERILVVGDSITGHSMNLRFGYTHQVRKALKEAGVNDVEFIPLGGSGQSVSSWRNVIRNSRDKNQKLDIAGIFVKEEFDKGSDTLIIFLGMNDALAPYTDFSTLPRWKAEYQKLIDDLKARVRFQKLILASPTMLTETPYSYKNRLMDEMAKLIRTLAKENGAEYLDTRETFQTYHEAMRKQNPKQNFMLDYVHPNELGHNCLTLSFLKAIGRKNVTDHYLRETMPGSMKVLKKPGMSLALQNSSVPGEFTIRGSLSGGDFKALNARLPEGLKLRKIEGTPADFTLTIAGEVRQLRNTVTVTAGPVKQTLVLNAPFLISTGYDGGRWFKPAEFRKEKAETRIDLDAKAGNDVTQSIVQGKKTQWLVYYPSADVTGGDDPNAVDFASVTNGRPFESGYLVRYIHAPEATKGVLSVGSKTFAGQEQVTVYLNGKEVYSDVVTAKKGKCDTVPVELKKGWNTLIARVCRVTWQWAASVGIRNADGSEISGLTYSITRK